MPGPAVIDTMSPSEVWELIFEALGEEILSIPLIPVEAQRIVFLPVKDLNYRVGNNLEKKSKPFLF